MTLPASMRWVKMLHYRGNLNGYLDGERLGQPMRIGREREGECLN